MKIERLFQAKANKKDEFYTQLKDIENELQYYVHHFKNKIIFMNADNPSYSNFWKYFKDNFSKLESRKIICTYYNPDNEVYKTEYDNYDAINVDRVNKIPKDYFGEMGVPITFLNKHVSEQFEIIGLDIYLDNHDGTRFQVDGKTKYARMIIKRKC